MGTPTIRISSALTRPLIQPRIHSTDTILLEANPEIDKALRLILSGERNSEELKRARERGEEHPKKMRENYGAHNIAVQLICEIKGGE